MASYPAFLAYDFVKDADSYSYSVKPNCLLPQAKWNLSGIDSNSSVLTGKNKSVRTTARPTFFKLNMTVNLNSNLVISSSVLGHTTLDGQFLTSIENNSKPIVYRSKIETNIYSSYDYNEKLEKLESITWCP